MERRATSPASSAAHAPIDLPPREPAGAAATPASETVAGEIEVSFVLPCLNEAETLEACILAARRCIDEHGLSAEIVVADNGSTDGSQDIARRCGARVVPVAEKGYGSALRGGFEAARGRYIIMGDADRSYDFAAAMPFVHKLREGHDLVMGSRFRGEIRPGAMPWKHKWIGNPVLSGVGRVLYRTGVSDFHCGLRAFTKAAYERMDVRTTGMEFASEMVMKAAMHRMRIAEVPITLYPDGRSRPPHLRSWRDGWRHLRFMLLCSPRWTFLLPGIVLLVAGLAVGAWLSGGARRVGGAVIDVHTLLVAGAACMVGAQLVWFALLAKTFAVAERLVAPDPRFARLTRFVTMEAGLVIGVVLGLAGVGLLTVAFGRWAAAGFGPRDYTQTMRIVIPAVTLTVLGVQAVFSSFLLGVLGLRRR